MLRGLLRRLLAGSGSEGGRIWGLGLGLCQMPNAEGVLCRTCDIESREKASGSKAKSWIVSLFNPRPKAGSGMRASKDRVAPLCGRHALGQVLMQSRSQISTNPQVKPALCPPPPPKSAPPEHLNPNLGRCSSWKPGFMVPGVVGFWGVGGFSGLVRLFGAQYSQTGLGLRGFGVTCPAGTWVHAASVLNLKPPNPQKPWPQKPTTTLNPKP